MNLNDLKNEMTSVPADSPVLLYIGVGTASATIATHPLLLEHYHQFPPFLQDMRNKVPNLHVFLLLIDPYQETPPRVAMDYNLIDKYQSGCHYQNAQMQPAPMQAFVYRLSVYTNPDVNPPNNGLNITGMLRDLNEFAKTQRISLVYHDFSGRNVALLADYFDHENADHLDQIIYGLSAREDHGCFFDLTQPSAYFPYYINHVENNRRPLVKMFNYYKQIVNQSYNETELQLYPPEMWEWAHIQKNQIVNKVRAHFKTVNLSLMRQVRKLMLGSSEAAPSEAAPSEDVEIDLYSLNELPKLYRDMFRDLFNEKNYDLLYELLFNYSASELDIIANLNKLEMTGEELLTFITLNEDPYKWYDVVNDLI
jgi:hypothetical protein